MIKRIIEKLFKLEPVQCLVCDVLRESLAASERERRELLQRVLAPPVPVVEKEDKEMLPIQPQYVPWRVRQQMLESEDRKRAQLTKEKEKEIAALEKELGVTDAVK
jgi:hypothetical protein